MGLPPAVPTLWGALGDLPGDSLDSRTGHWDPPQVS